MLILVTAIFMTAFYFFFKNSRADSPLSDKEYMEQLSAASKRYQTAGKNIDELSPNAALEESTIHEPSMLDKFLSFVDALLK